MPKSVYRDDIKIYKVLSLHLFTLQLHSSVEKSRDGALYIYFHFYIIPTLFANFLACHPRPTSFYIFNVFLLLYIITCLA